MVSEAKYWAFISYSHADERWASWLHRSLETYKVPRPLVGTKGPDGVTVRPARLFPLFRDREELASASSLSGQIEEALRTSRNLIVICSPRAARSRWVNEEVKAFKAMGREERVFCLIVDGEPNAAGTPELECFPEAVRFGVDAERRITAEPSEPIAADARPDKDGRRHALLKLLAGILDAGFDNLRLRDQERRMRRYAVTSAVLLGAVIAFAAIAYYALLQRDAAEREAREERASSSGRVAMSSQLSFAESPPRSLLLAVAALQITGVRQEPRVAAAEEALRSALAQAGGVAFPGWEKETAVALSPNGRWLTAASTDGAGARLWDLTADGARRRAIELRGGSAPVAISPDSRWLVTMGREDAPARLWDLARKDPGAGPRLLPQARGPIAFSRDRRWLVTGGADRSVRL